MDTKKCESCGNHYENAFEIIVNGESHFFDCFECAIQSLAPQCAHCGTKIIGHGNEARGQIFCCEHCARAEVHQRQEDEIQMVGT